MANLRETYLNTRNLNVFPKEALNAVFSNPQFTNVASGYRSYLNELSQENTGASPEEISLTAHALISYLHILRSENLAHFAETALLPRKVDPYTTVSPEHPDTLLIADWEAQHDAIRRQEDAELVDELCSNSPKGKIIFYHGSMYGNKTGRMLWLIRELSNRAFMLGKKVHAFTSGDLLESVIKSREGVRPHTGIATVHQIPAMGVDADTLMHELRTREFNQGDIIAIDEITFIAFGDDCRIIYSQLQQLTDLGVNVLIGGIRADYRDLSLDFAAFAAVQTDPNIVQRSCNAFYAYEEYGKLYYGNGDSTTFRINLFGPGKGGFADFRLPLKIGRELSFMVEYNPLPAQVHPFGALRRRDEEVFELLLKYGGNEQLKQYWIDKHEASQAES